MKRQRITPLTWCLTTDAGVSYFARKEERRDRQRWLVWQDGNIVGSFKELRWVREAIEKGEI
jgi:hypothetical protein